VGVFTFCDGSTYEGWWRRGKKHGLGIFTPAQPGVSAAVNSRALAGACVGVLCAAVCSSVACARAHGGVCV
jgi:hypothetical protein